MRGEGLANLQQVSSAGRLPEPPEVPTAEGRTVGYARVSTEEQNLDLQLRALRSAGCEVIYTDHVSGSTQSRPGLNQAIEALRAGDRLVVWRLDRLGRSLVHLVQMLDRLGERQIKFCSLCEHIDTFSSGGRLVFHMMAALAEFERGLISERTRAGMAAAKSRGKHLGRHPSMNEEEQRRALLLIRQGNSVISVAQNFDVAPRTVYRMLQRIQQPLWPAAAGEAKPTAQACQQPRAMMNMPIAHSVALAAEPAASQATNHELPLNQRSGG